MYYCVLLLNVLCHILCRNPEGVGKAQQGERMRNYREMEEGMRETLLLGCDINPGTSGRSETCKISCLSVACNNLLTNTKSCLTDCLMRAHMAILQLLVYGCTKVQQLYFSTTITPGTLVNDIIYRTSSNQMAIE